MGKLDPLPPLISGWISAEGSNPISLQCDSMPVPEKIICRPIDYRMGTTYRFLAPFKFKISIDIPLITHANISVGLHSPDINFYNTKFTWPLFGFGDYRSPFTIIVGLANQQQQQQMLPIEPINSKEHGGSVSIIGPKPVLDNFLKDTELPVAEHRTRQLDNIEGVPIYRIGVSIDTYRISPPLPELLVQVANWMDSNPEAAACCLTDIHWQCSEKELENQQFSLECPAFLGIIADQITFGVSCLSKKNSD